MFSKIAVGDVMTKNFISVKPSANLLECAKQFVRKRVGSLIVVQNKHLIGILTERDILWTLIKNPKINLKEVKAVDIATKKVAVIKPSADITQAFQKMKNYNLKRLPVMSKGEVVGLLTLKDILRIEPELYQKAGELITIREESEKLKGLTLPHEHTEGLCENCGAFAELLKIENKLLCTDCREEFD